MDQIPLQDHSDALKRLLQATPTMDARTNNEVQELTEATARAVLHMLEHIAGHEAAIVRLSTTLDDLGSRTARLECFP